MEEEGEVSEFVRRFRQLPMREKHIMFDVLFTESTDEAVARLWDLSGDRLEAIVSACLDRLGMTP